MASFKFWHYFILSSLLMLSMIIYACITREQFYPIILLLVTSKISFLLLLNMIFALTLLIGQVIIKVFYGQLRDVEYELIIERSKYSITETCLALTIFRNDLSPMIFCFFLFLLFLKIFHWLSRSRLDYLEQVARVSISTHTMLLIMLILLIIIDSIICYNCVIYSLSKGKTVIVLFSFEFGVLLLTALNNLVRYLVNLIDGMYENGLNYKGLYFMILDLICDGLKFCTYAGFFCLVFVYYGLPIHIIRDVWMAFSAFYHRLISLIKYLKLTNRLEERFEDATPEELAEAHECLICREGMDRGKKLPCKHVFHLDCLRMWLQHQQTCPLCRAEIPIVALPNSNQVNQANNGNNANQAEVNQQVPDLPQNNIQDRNVNLDIRNINILPEPAAAAVVNQNRHNFNQNNLHNHNLDHSHDYNEQSSLYLEEILDSSKSTETPTLPNQIINSIPGFFVVLATDQSGIDLKLNPNYSDNNQTIRTIPQKTIVFATDFTTVIPPGENENFSIIWLHLPDGWVPLEHFERNPFTTIIITPLLRSYSPIVTKKVLVSERSFESPSRSQYNSYSPSRADTSILPQSASGSSDRSHRKTRDSSEKKDQHSHHLRKVIMLTKTATSRSKYTSSPSSISRAIMKAKDDISALTQSLREASNEQISSSTSLTSNYSSLNSPRFDPPSPNRSNFSGRINRLLAMQQQIDILSSSILEIQESLTSIREGLASAMADELSFQEQELRNLTSTILTTATTTTALTSSSSTTTTTSAPETRNKSSSSSSSSSEEDHSLSFLNEDSYPIPDLNIEFEQNYENKDEEVKKQESIGTIQTDDSSSSDIQSNNIQALRARYFDMMLKNKAAQKEDSKVDTIIPNNKDNNEVVDKENI